MNNVPLTDDLRTRIDAYLTATDIVPQFANDRPYLKYTSGGSHNIPASPESIEKEITRRKGTEHIPDVSFELIYQRLLELSAAVSLQESLRKEQEEIDFDPTVYLATFLEQFSFQTLLRTFTQNDPNGGYNHITRSSIIAQALIPLKFKGVSKQTFDLILTELIVEKQREELSRIRKELKYDSTCTEEVVEIINYFFHFYGVEQTAENLTMTLHWFWQLKRCLYGYPKGTYPIMLVMSGPGKIGKSSFVQFGLKQCLNGMVGASSIGYLSNDNNARAKLSSCYVLELPEMDNGETPPNELNELLKRRIEEDTISTRDHHSMEVGSTMVTCVMLGTTNKTLPEVIYDDTGMRRYWELRCTSNIPIDQRIEESMELWSGLPIVLRGIDEKNEKGYWDTSTDVGKKIIHAQGELVKQDTVEVYLQELDLLPVNKNDILPGEAHLLRDFPTFFGSYVTWCGKGGYRLWRNIDSVKTLIIHRYGSTIERVKNPGSKEMKTAQGAKMYCVSRSKREEILKQLKEAV